MERTRAPQRYVRLNHTFGDCICIRRRGQCRRKKLRWSFFSLRFRFIAAATKLFQGVRFFLYALFCSFARSVAARTGRRDKPCNARFKNEAALRFSRGVRRAVPPPVCARRTPCARCSGKRTLKSILFRREKPKHRGHVTRTLPTSYGFHVNTSNKGASTVLF